MTIEIPAAVFAILMTVLYPCEYEDSRNCAWNAQEQGNGKGRSFVDIDGIVYIASAD